MRHQPRQYQIGWIAVMLLIFLGLLALAPRHANAQQAQQCVSNAQASGTGDAQVIPLLPCAFSTNILILTSAGSNATSTPTLQMTGYPAQPIINYDGGTVAIGELGPLDATIMLTSTGNGWQVIAPSAVSTGTIPVSRGGTGTDLSGTGGTNQVVKQLTVGGNFSVGTINCAFLSDDAASCSTDTTVATNITSGTLPTGRLTGSYTGITGVGTIGTGTWAGTTIGVTVGGTGATTLTDHGVLFGSGTSAITPSTAMTNGQILVGQTAADPLPKTVSGDCTLALSGAITCTSTSGTAFGALATLGVGTGLSSSAGNLIITSTITGAGPIGGATSIPVITYNARGQLTTVTTATPTVTSVNGVSFPTTFTAHGVLFGNGAGNFGVSSAMTNGQLLLGATGADPAPQTMSQDCTIGSTGVINSLKTNNVSVGTFATASVANPPAIGTGTPAAATFTTIHGTGAATFDGNITAAALDTAGTVAGSLCQTSAGLFEYEVGVNCFATPGTGTVTSVTASTPGSTLSLGGTNPITSAGTISFDINLSHANTWAALQQFATGDLAFANAGGGLTTLAGASSASNFTATLPAATDTVVELAATQSLTNKTLASGVLTGTFTGTHTVSGTVTLSGSNNFTSTFQVSGNTMTFPGTAQTLAGLGTNQVWTASQRVTLSTVAISTATFTPNFDTGADFSVTLVHASCPCTLANPSTTPVAGQHGVIYITQSATGGDVISTWGSQYISSGGTSSITFSTAANAIDVFSYAVKDSTHIVLTPAATNVVH